MYIKPKSLLKLFRITEYREEKKEEGDKVARRIKGGNKKERDRSSQ